MIAAKTVKAVFLDRDGVINVDVGFTHKNHQLEFIPRSLDALKLLAQSNYMLFIITNQPVIGRGICTEQEYLDFQNYMIKRIEEAGGRIDKFYYCPHHPKHGIGKYLKDCKCRKPKPGLLLQAEKEFNIDLKKSFMIGDKRSDIKAGQAAGCTSILVKTGYGAQGGDTDTDFKPDHISEDLFDAVMLILKQSTK